MKTNLTRTNRALYCALAIAAGAAWSACTRSVAAGQPTPQARASVTVYPILMAGRPSPEAAQAVALLLEKAGLERIELAEVAFESESGADAAEQADAFAGFVQRQAPATDYGLLGCFLGTPGKGVDEVRGVLASPAGKVVWRDRQGPKNAAFEASPPTDPMSCCVFLVRRLRGPLELADPLRAGAPEGEMAARFRAKSGIPDAAELAAIERRQQQLRAAAPGATVLVYPIRVGGEYSKAIAEALADAINTRGLLTAKLADAAVRFTAKASPNEQLTLWSGAHSIEEHLREHPPEADYALFADYLLAGDRVGAVHLYLCDRAGELVIVDFQNSHHADFERIAPRSREDCTELATVRLAGYLD